MLRSFRRRRRNDRGGYLFILRVPLWAQKFLFSFRFCIDCNKNMYVRYKRRRCARGSARSNDDENDLLRSFRRRRRNDCGRQKESIVSELKVSFFVSFLYRLQQKYVRYKRGRCARDSARSNDDENNTHELRLRSFRRRRRNDRGRLKCTKFSELVCKSYLYE